jgi:hypothetical protein
MSRHKHKISHDHHDHQDIVIHGEVVEIVIHEKEESPKETPLELMSLSELESLLQSYINKVAELAPFLKSKKSL